MTPEQDPLWPHIVERCVNTRNFTAFRRYITKLLTIAEPNMAPKDQAEFTYRLWRCFSTNDEYAVSEDCQNAQDNPLREHILVLLSTHAIGKSYAQSI